MKCYENITTNEIVYEEFAEDYVLDRLGITIKPKGIDGEYTLEQIESINSIVEWYFSGNWIETEIEEQEEPNIFELIDEECEYDERYYI